MSSVFSWVQCHHTSTSSHWKLISAYFQQHDKAGQNRKQLWFQACSSILVSFGKCNGQFFTGDQGNTTANMNMSRTKIGHSERNLLSLSRVHETIFTDASSSTINRSSFPICHHDAFCRFIRYTKSNMCIYFSLSCILCASNVKNVYYTFVCYYSFEQNMYACVYFSFICEVEITKQKWTKY